MSTTGQFGVISQEWLLLKLDRQQDVSLSPWHINMVMQRNGTWSRRLNFELQKVKERNSLRWQKTENVTKGTGKLFDDSNIELLWGGNPMQVWMWWLLLWAHISELWSCSRQNGNCADCGKFYVCMDISGADSQSRYWCFNVLWRKQHGPLPSYQVSPWDVISSLLFFCDGLLYPFFTFLVLYIIFLLITHFPHFLSIAEWRAEVTGQRRESLHPGTYSNGSQCHSNQCPPLPPWSPTLPSVSLTWVSSTLAWIGCMFV